MNKIELPALHKDMYYFGYGIDIEKPIEMANIIIELQQENKILKENAENNDKVVDKVNWENQLLKKENEQLKKQVDEYKKLGFKHLQDKNNNLEIQQKEFINYLENMLDDENDIFSVVRVKDVLQKYKEIIGVSDDKTN